jgi:hypothetical protein
MSLRQRLLREFLKQSVKRNQSLMKSVARRQRWHKQLVVKAKELSPKQQVKSLNIVNG